MLKRQETSDGKHVKEYLSGDQQGKLSRLWRASKNHPNVEGGR